VLGCLKKDHSNFYLISILLIFVNFKAIDYATVAALTPGRACAFSSYVNYCYHIKLKNYEKIFKSLASWFQSLYNTFCYNDKVNKIGFTSLKYLSMVRIATMGVFSTMVGC
jgi:hypothetical protein